MPIWKSMKFLYIYKSYLLLNISTQSYIDFIMYYQPVMICNDCKNYTILPEHENKVLDQCVPLQEI